MRYGPTSVSIEHEGTTFTGSWTSNDEGYVRVDSEHLGSREGRPGSIPKAQWARVLLRELAKAFQARGGTLPTPTRIRE